MSRMMCSRIIFPANERRKEFIVSLVSSVKIESSWKMLTDTAEVVLPRRIRFFGGKEAGELIRTGDRVKIDLGYGDELSTEFEGYILAMTRSIPVTVRCEDEMFRLKRKTVSYSARNVTLRKLLGIVAGADYEVRTDYDVDLGAVRYVAQTVASVLDDIRKKTNLYCYFSGKTLCCGNAYTDKAQAEKVKIVLERNAVGHDLTETEGSYQVKAVSMGPNGSKTEATVGEDGGELYQLTYNVKGSLPTEAQLREWADAFYQGLKKQKYKGGIELFGIPVVHPADAVEVSSSLTPEVNGSYLVEKVIKEFSDNATYRQKIELGGRAE